MAAKSEIGLLRKKDSVVHQGQPQINLLESWGLKFIFLHSMHVSHNNH